MEVIRFIFSSFWTWLGVLLLVCAVFGGTAEVVKAFRRNRKVTAYRMGERWHVQVENASREDVTSAMYAPGVILSEAPYTEGAEDAEGAEDE